MLTYFKNLSCYEEFEIQSTLMGISKVDILEEIGYKIDNYYFFISEDGIFNWFDLKGNHIENPDVLKELKEVHIPKNITKCIIPNSIISISINAFSDCDSLTSITIPNSVTSIDVWAFAFCYSLTSITIPNSVINIGNSVFWGCESLTSIIIPDSVTSIGDWAFWGCKSLKEVVFKGKTLNEVKQIENYSFGIEDENVFKFS